MTTRREINLCLLAAAGVALAPSLAAAQDLAPIELPPPRADFGSRGNARPTYHALADNES